LLQTYRLILENQFGWRTAAGLGVGILLVTQAIQLCWEGVPK
jgi:hypothetical protein